MRAIDLLPILACALLHSAHADVPGQEKRKRTPPAQSEGSMVKLNLSKTGSLSLGTKTLSNRELTKEVERRIAKKKDLKILINVHLESKHRRLAEIVSALQSAGVDGSNMAVRTTPKK